MALYLSDFFSLLQFQVSAHIVLSLSLSLSLSTVGNNNSSLLSS